MPMTQYRFSVKMFDFSAQDLNAAEPYLKLDFDKFKLFQTDKELNTKRNAARSGSFGGASGRATQIYDGGTAAAAAAGDASHSQDSQNSQMLRGEEKRPTPKNVPEWANPEWGFKAAFMYRTKALDKLPTKKFRIFCFDAAEKNPAEKVSAEVDLATLACGPPCVRLTLRDAQGFASGTIKFMCVMKMYKTDVTVTFDRICLTMQGSPAPARLHIALNEETGVDVPYSATGEWEDIRLTCEASLSDLLSVVEPAFLTIKAFDESQGVLVGEVRIGLRSHMSLDSDRTVTVEQNVIYEDDLSEGSMCVGELAATLSFKNLPTYAQMESGILLDDGVEGGCLLFEGLPYPARCKMSPPIFEDDCLPEQRRLIPPVPGEREDDEQNWSFHENLPCADLKVVDLPPYWEMKKTPWGKPYFVDHRTITWKDPRFLPENWDQRIDPDNGKVYYAYHKTRQTTYKDPRGCATEHWDMRLSKKGQVYYIFTPRKLAHFCDPRGLPRGFEALLDAKGRLYFRNHNEKVTQWSDPRHEKAGWEKKKFLEEEHREWWQQQVDMALEASAKEAQEAADRDEDDRDEDGNSIKLR